MLNRTQRIFHETPGPLKRNYLLYPVILIWEKSEEKKKKKTAAAKRLDMKRREWWKWARKKGYEETWGEENPMSFFLLPSFTFYQYGGFKLVIPLIAPSPLPSSRFRWPASSSCMARCTWTSQST